MISETITERDEVLIRRLVLSPGEATPWHTDACERFTVVVQGSRLRIEYADGDAQEVDLSPGTAGWDQPEQRLHRAVNAGDSAYEEVVTFFRSHAEIEVQPEATP